MKKLLSVLSSTLQAGVRRGLLFLALLSSVSALYASDTQVDGIWYDFDSNTKTASVTYRGSRYNSYSNEYSGSVVIPETVTYNGITYSVTSIGDWAFSHCSSLTSVTIGESVTGIGEYAFFCCSSLTSAIIGNSVTNIGNSAFSGCSSLTSITIPNSVTSIGNSAFSDCSSLTSITIPNSVTSIGNSAFYRCSSLTSVTIPESVTGIGEYAFYDCSSLTSVTLPNSVTSIGYSAFKWCTSLASVTLGNSVTNIGGYAFSSCALTSITIPESVTSIGYAAFAFCSSPTSVVWNAIKCDDCSDSPFDNVTSLTFGDSVEYIPADLCYKMDNITTINIPNSVDSIGEYAFFGCSSLTSATIGNSVTNIGDGAFSGCSSLTSITIPNSVTSIEGWTFSGCSSLTSITIPDSITSIGEDAFKGCSSLTDITIPNSVTSIGDCAFYRCSSLTSVTIPNSVTSIGDHAFYDCTSLVSVVWNATNYTSDAYYVFDSDTPYQITSFVFGDSVKCIPSYLCGSMSALTSITIPNSVTSIGYSAFAGCSSLTSITIPNSVTSMGEYAFRNCKSLSSVVIGNRVTKIRTETFKDCSSLTSVTIGKKVKEIGADAFYGCSALTQTNYTGDVASWCKINFNYMSNPTSYSKNLFINGEEVKDVLIPNTVSSISNYAFYNCENISSVTIPESVKSIGNDAFAGCKKLFDIYCYPTTPPEAQENSFANYNVNLYVPCESLKDYQMDMVFGSFKYIQCLEDTPPSEPQDTTIYLPIVYETICEGETFVWMGMEFTAAGMFISEEIVEDENYIYHYIYTLELQVLPSSIDTIVVEAYDSYEWHGKVYTKSGTYIYENFCSIEVLELTIIDTPTPPSEPQDTTIYIYYTEDVTICEGETLTWRGMEYTETGTYTYAYEEIVEEDDYIYHYHHIYTLDLTVIAPMILVWPVEAYDSYEWHGVVYTESGTYLYEEWCFQEILELTIIPSTETAVDNMQTDSDHSAQKILRDQQILILRDGKTYTIMGAEIK